MLNEYEIQEAHLCCSRIGLNRFNYYALVHIYKRSLTPRIILYRWNTNLFKLLVFEMKAYTSTSQIMDCIEGEETVQIN